MNHRPGRHPTASRTRPASRTSRATVPALLSCLLGATIPLLPLVAPLAIAPDAAAGAEHPRWKEFVTWLMDKKRTPEEDLILRYILSGGSRFTWFDVYAHSMQEQTEALFQRWLGGDGNPRRNPNLGTRPPENGRR